MPLVFHQFQLKSYPAEPTGASCSEHPFQSTFCSQQVFVPGRAASPNTHTPLLTREEAFPSALERSYYGEGVLWAVLQGCAGNPCSVPAGSWHLNWADCTQITLLVNWDAELIKHSSTEAKSWTISEMTQPVCFPVCKEHSHLSPWEWPFQTSAGQCVQKMHVKASAECYKELGNLGWCYTCKKLIWPQICQEKEHLGKV